VFQKPDFVRQASQSFVFVELDFTFGDSKEERRREQVDRELQKRYLDTAVPAVYLFDQQGVPYAIFDGYDAGTGPQRMLARLEAARAARIERDGKFAAAAKAAGHERAELLHAGLQTVAGLLGSLKDRGDDPILTFYPTVVAEIRRLESPDRRPLLAVYDARQKKRDEWIALNAATFDRLNEFKKAKDYKGAIAFIDDTLKRITTPDVRWRLEFARQVYLEWDDQYAAGLENARRLLRDPNRTPQQEEELLERESYNLWNSGRIDEALAQSDRRIRDAEGSPKKRLRLLAWKAEMLLSHRKTPGVKPAERIKAWRDFRAAAQPRSDDWRRATRLLAVQLQWERDYREALKLQRELLQVVPENSSIMLDAAESHLALHENEVARTLIRDAEQALPANPERQVDKNYEQRIRARIAGLRDRLAKPSK
jgi:hypothetical protein